MKSCTDCFHWKRYKGIHRCAAPVPLWAKDAIQGEHPGHSWTSLTCVDMAYADVEKCETFKAKSRIEDGNG